MKLYEKIKEKIKVMQPIPLKTKILLYGVFSGIYFIVVIVAVGLVRIRVLPEHPSNLLTFFLFFLLPHYVFGFIFLKTKLIFKLIVPFATSIISTVSIVLAIYFYCVDWFVIFVLLFISIFAWEIAYQILKKGNVKKYGEKTIEMDFTLRPFSISDLENLVKYANNYNIAKFLTNQFPHPYTEEDGRKFISSVANSDPVNIFAIEVNGEAVGSIGIFPQSDIHEKNAEMGYWLAEPFWGNGIVTRAIGEIVEYGFNTFEITRIFARPFSTNPASQRVLEKAGFTCEVRLKNAIYKNGNYIDEMIYAINKEL